jgi:hypothetical protein
LLSSLHAVLIACASSLTQRLNGVPGSGSLRFDRLSPWAAQTCPSARLDAGVTGLFAGVTGLSAGRLSVPGLSVPEWGGMAVGRCCAPVSGPAPKAGAATSTIAPTAKAVLKAFLIAFPLVSQSVTGCNGLWARK